MNTVRQRMYSKLLVSMLAFAVGAYAEEATSVKGTFTAKYVKQEMVPIAPEQGTMMWLGEAQGSNRNTGRGSFMDGAKVVNRDLVDVVGGNGPHRGYATLSKDGGEVVVKWSGDVATMMAKDKPPLITFRGTWQYVSGTGKYQGIQGRGTYSGHFTSQTEYVADWIGQYTLPLAGR